jgi:hypothetical protein
MGCCAGWVRESRLAAKLHLFECFLPLAPVVYKLCALFFDMYFERDGWRGLIG